jgi:short-subunit dehydrogenase
MDFSKKVVVITGASSGIGRALANEFANQGAYVVAAARSKDKLLTLENQPNKTNGKLMALTTDVSREEDCRKLIETTIKEFGKIDILISNAGVSMRALFEDTDLHVIRRLMDVNFWGTVYCTKYALPYLLKSKGSLVGVSSVAGYKGLPGRTGYSASKFAMQGFLGVVRTENMKKGLHVLIACPGFTSSNIRNTALAADGTQQGESPRDENKMMSADDVALRIIKSITKRKRNLVLTTEGRLIVFLNKFFPTLLDQIIYNQLAKEPDSPFK